MINEAVIDRSGKYTTIFINTRQGKEEVIVDQEDIMVIEELQRLVIYKDPKNRKLARTGKEDDQVLLHRYLFDIPKGSRLEWVNENTLDLRRENLQLVDREGNVTPLAPKDPNSTYEIMKSLSATGNKQAKELMDKINPSKKKESSVQGVYFHKASQRWHAAAFYEKKRYSLGYFQEEADAVEQVTIFRADGPNSPKLKRNQRKGN
jgi:hypothetical protein